MAKTLQDYITESEAWVDQPAVGDDFAITIREECLVESHIVDVVEDGVILAADDRMIEILESYGLLEGEQLDELSLKTLDSYATKAGLSNAARRAGMALAQQKHDDSVIAKHIKPRPKFSDAEERKMQRRGEFVGKAIDRLRSGVQEASTDDSDRMLEILESYGLLENQDPYRREVSPPSAEEFEEGLNVKQIRRDLESGMSHDAVIGKHANKRTTNTDQVRRIIQQHAWEKRMNKPKAKGVAEGTGSGRVYFKVIDTTGTGMPPGFHPVSKIEAIEDGYYIELDQPGLGMNYTKHNYKNFALRKDSPKGIPITGKQAYDIVNKQGMAEGSKEKTPGIALSKAYKKDFDNKKPGQDRKEIALTGTYSKTGKPGGELKKQGVAEGWNDHLDDPDDYEDYIEKLRDLADIKRKEKKENPPIDKDQGVAEGSQELRRIQELAGMPAKAPQVTEGAVKRTLDDLYYDFKDTYTLPPDISDDDYLQAVVRFLSQEGVDSEYFEDIGELFIDMRDHEEDDDHDYANNLDAEQYDDERMMEDPAQLDREIDYDSLEVDGIDTSDYPDFSDAYFSSGQYTDGTPLPDEVLDQLSDNSMLLRQHLEQQIYEAEYRGRKVPLGKPMAGDVKKSKVYVKGPKGNVVKVNFGDKTMRIKKSNPKRRKNFRARHNCANPGPRWKARYWSCRAW